MKEHPWIYVVKTDTPTQGKGVAVSTTVDEALEDIRPYLERGVSIHVERIIGEAESLERFKK